MSDRRIERIESLDDPTAIEAAQLFAAAVGASAAEPIDSEILERPLEHRSDIADLSRLLLLIATSDPEMDALVAESLAGAGRKQLVLGGTELVILAGLALGALQTCLTKGRTSSEKTVTIERKADGSAVVTTRESIRYGISAKLASLLGSLVKLGQESGSSGASGDVGGT